MKFRKKPIVIEAWRFIDENLETLFNEPQFKDKVIFEINMLNVASCFINTLEGTMKANSGDWIIKGIKGEMYPIKDEIFQLTYEAVDE